MITYRSCRLRQQDFCKSRVKKLQKSCKKYLTKTTYKSTINKLLKKVARNMIIKQCEDKKIHNESQIRKRITKQTRYSFSFEKTNESYKFLIESLILAQDERWRRA